MTSTTTLLERNSAFAHTFDAADLPIIPKMRTVILACGDARVDPAHVIGLDLGDAVVIRNNGARVTQAVVEEIATLAFLVGQMDGGQIDGGKPGPFNLILMQHTQCGAERFADPNLQNALKAKIGVDVSSVAITDHEQSLHEDIERLRAAPEMPDYVVVSALLYDVKTGAVQEVVPPSPLG